MPTKEKSSSALTMHQWANIHSIATSHFRTSSLHGMRRELGEHADEPAADGEIKPKHLDYQSLFAEVDAAGPVDHDSSILSPAAYFVDLMRLIKAKITQGTQNKWDGLVDLKLKKRRPDLWEIGLDAENTTTEVPYLEIVNNVMRAHLAEVAGMDAAGLTDEQRRRQRKRMARQLLATAEYPFDLPVHMPLLQIRTCLAHFGVKLTDIYQAFGLAAEKDAWVAEVLGLSSPDELTYLANPDCKVDSLCKAFGFRETTDPQRMGMFQRVARFLAQTALTPDELSELMQLEIPPWYWNEAGEGKLVIQEIKPGRGGVEWQHFRNVLDSHNLRLDYLNRFIRLRRRLGWSFSDLHWALRSIGADLAKRVGEDPEGASKMALVDKNTLPELAQVKHFSDKYKLPVDVVCSFAHELNTTPGIAAPSQPEPKSLFDRVFNTPPFYRDESSAGGSAYQPWDTEADPWDSTGLDPKTERQHPGKAKRSQAIRASLLAALNLGNDDLQVIVDHCSNEDLFDRELRLDPTKIRLDVATLTRLYRISKMASVLGMRVREYLVLLRCITGQGMHRLGAPEVSSLNDLQAIDYWADWLKEAGLTPYELAYLTTGSMTGETQHSVDPGWTDESLKQLTSGLHATLKSRFITAQTFAQGTIGSEMSAFAVAALREAGLIVGAGLVQCPVSEVSVAPEEFPIIIQRQVSDALESFTTRYKFGKVTVGVNLQAGVTTLAVSGDRQTLLAATAIGVFCFRQRDDEWVESIREEASPAGICALALTPDGGSLFAATNKQLFRSTNYGRSWQKCEVEGFHDAYICALAVTPDGNTIYAGTDGGLYCSIDGGREWNHLLRELQPETYEQVTAVAIGPDRQSLFAAIQVKHKGASNPVLSNAVFHSADAGKTWEKTDVNVDNGVIIESLTVDSRGEILCASRAKGIFKGFQWSDISSPGTGSTGVTAVVVDADGESIIAADDNGGLFRCYGVWANSDAFFDAFISEESAIKEITDSLNRELNYQMQSTIQQMAAILNQDWHLVASVVDYLNPRERGAWKFLTADGLRDAGLLLYLAKVFKLSIDGFDAVLKNPSLFGLASSRSNIRVNLDTIRAVHAFAGQVETFRQQGSRGEKTAPLLADLALRWSVDDLTDADSKTLTTLGGWQDSQVRALHEHLRVMSTTTDLANPATTKPSVAGLATMKRGFDLAAKLGVDVQTLIQLCKLHDAETGFDQFSAAAHGLLGVVKSKYSDDEWEKIFGPIRDHLNEQERSALVGLLMHQLRQNEVIAKHFDGMNSRQDLSDYLLIDVEMSGLAKVSVVKQGLNTLQRYIQRCHMGLEGEGAVTFPIGDKAWAWRSHYRLWEANRKVFLYPENYLDPGLRKIKTPLFRELEEELLQGEITDGAVTNAYINYFDKLDELASLKVVDIRRSMAIHPGVPDGGEDTLFVLGRTDKDPAVYYVRSAVLDGNSRITTWRPWQRIALTIHSDQVGCVYINRRLHIFWVESKVTTDRDKARNKTTTVKATVKYSYQNMSGKWFPPQLLPDLNDLLVWQDPVTEKDDLKSSIHLGGWQARPRVLVELWSDPEHQNHGGSPPGIKWSLAADAEDAVSFETADYHGTPVNAVWILWDHTNSANPRYVLNSTAAHELREKLISGGVGELLLPASQAAKEVVFVNELGVGDGVLDFHLSSPYAIYYREIFFHIPFLIADTLNRNQRFEEAQKWYHHIFNPMPVSGGAGESDEERYWRYLPFRGHTLEKLKDIEKNNPGEFKIYTDDPFDPHAIAGLRLGAYEKAIVMKYIDNLLDWGDQLFAQDSWESIVQASMLYVMAQDLLGKKRKQTQPAHSPKPANRYDELDREIDPEDPFHVEDTSYFPVAPNANFSGYWDRADDRLFKIRHCMNIKGIVRQLALFQPPIDPRQLIRAMAAGQEISSVASQLAAAVPHYRFTSIIQQAKNVTSTLTQLGSALLSALEKKDAEQLNLLRSAHEKTILNLTTKIKQKQIEDAGKNLASLNTSLAAAMDRKRHYRNLIDGRLSTEETASLNLMVSALAFQTASAPLHAISVPAHLTPSIYGLADGGSKFGNAVQVAAQVSDSTAAALNQGSQLAATKAQNERRKEEWELQEALAGHDVEQIQTQIDAATLKQEVAQMELDMHQKSIEQADEREDLLRGKFTKRDLYQWMVGRISSVYFQTYKIAFDLAQTAEKAYQYERNTDKTLITFGYWDSLKKGLLAGEGLMFGLNQLEKAYMDDNERPLEIEKTISLNQLDLFSGNPEKTTLNGLKKNGKCTFHLTERLFDQDFPGHYCRKIKSIAITIPAVVGPYQNVQATLKQTLNRVLLKPDPAGVDYLLNGKSNGAGLPDSIRLDWRRQQQIAISKGVNDSGMFELNFRDERYLPFEGTGAVSDWELEMRKEANESILESVSDVIIHLRYTAENGAAAI